jgi:carbamate kinase
LVGVEAVIHKDLCAGLLAQDLGVDCLVIATDGANVFL